MINTIDTVDALQSLKPNAEWVLRGDELEWLDSEQTEPTALELSNEVTRLQAVYDSQLYARTRKAKYDLLNQDEMRYDDLINNTTTWRDGIAAIKVAHPKPQEYQMSTIKSSAENLTLNADGANNDVIIQSNGSTKVTVDGQNSRVGIGTTAPAHNVEIVATASGSVNDTLQIRNNATASGTGSRIRFINSTDANSDTNGASIASIRTGDNNDLTFETENVEAMRIDATGAVTMPSQPAFLARPSSTQSNIAVGTLTTVVLGTEVFDNNADFSSNTFTAPVTGKYQLNLNLRTQSTPNMSYMWVRINTSNRTYTQICSMNRFASYDLDYWGYNLAVLADMDASDTADIKVYIGGGAAQIDIENSSTDFSGYLVC